MPALAVIAVAMLTLTASAQPPEGADSPREGAAATEEVSAVKKLREMAGDMDNASNLPTVYRSPSLFQNLPILGFRRTQ